MSSRSLLAVLFAGLVAPAACTTSPPVVPPSEYGVIRYRLLEHDASKTHVVPPTGFQTVDADSKLVLDIESLRPTGEVPPSHDWAVLNGLLQDLQELARRRNDLLTSAAAPEVRKEEREAFNAEVFEFFNETFFKALHELQPLASEEEEEQRFNRIFTGRFRAGLDPSRTYENVALWLRERLAEEAEEAKRVAARGDEEEIGVVAFHRSSGKNWTRIPVYNYDEIASTGSQEKKTSILSLSAADRERLAMELAQAQRAKNFLKNIGGEIKELQRWRDEVVAEIRRSLDELAERLSQGLEGWAGLLAQAVERAQTLELPDASPAATARGPAVLALSSLAQDFDNLARLAELVRKIAGALDADGDPTVVAALLPGMDLVQGLDQFLAGVQSARETIETWDERVAAVGSFLDALTAEQRVELLPDALRQPLEEARSAVLPVLERLEEIAEALGFDQRGKAEVDGLALLAELDLSSDIPFHLASSAPDGIIRLEDVGVSEGDDVLVQIVARPHAGGAVVPQDPRIVAQYHLEASQINLHDRFGADAILARASTGPGDATEWKPNAAVTWNLHYRFRHPNRGGRFFNWLHPGVGLHAASLDQADDSVEFGLGANLSLWDGLLSGGVGVNLSLEEDRGYFLIGTSLFKLIGPLTTVTESSSP